jgi:23S rRNA (uracil-5-)-methyltransferase RumA
MEALCKHFGKCGGCTLQHIEYAEQLKHKKMLLAKAIGYEEINVFSGNPYEYRNRMDFVFYPQGLGLRARGNWKQIVPIDVCVISEKRVNALLAEVNAFFKKADIFDIRKKTGTLRYAVIRTAKESAVSFVMNEDSSKLQESIEQVKAFAEHSIAENVLITYVPAKSDVSISSDYFAVKGSDVLTATYLGKTFQYAVQGFFQNNHVMAEKMQEYVHGLMKMYTTHDAFLLDVYAGVGTFGIVNAGLFKQVTIVESVKECIDAANINLEKNAVKNAQAHVMDAKQIYKLNLKSPLYIITDPPRSGMDEKTIYALNQLQPEVIIYISCNIEQLAKELPKLKGYVIKSVALFDLFPQTPHSEAIVELVKS